ncbi:MAG: class II fumarate hydratase [Candidatus Krumholzibacteria bacterium]|nr:class II fumarate hydratase [Candidatus Krumholzibacteria bacterium]MDH4337731.1 class II fumarate hydratase [Candidatus Krumholzibacteria bacterium]MDH5270641.1 class II fumarate hydratase [Candidatus Krumholzibacteria bacterium]MDH5627150.1 class II fumarate hydratase [Candidatus Krumholzibacteria bacterium]
MSKYRIEKDSLGEMRIPETAYYGAQTARAVENFPISGITFPRHFIRALGIIKRACARANVELGDLDPKIGDAIAAAATEVIEGKLDAEFPLDIYQTGSGTSTNMNANEVIANRAAEIMGKERGHKSIHPNDHVNMSQSSNDVIPTAIHVAAAYAITRELVPALEHLGLTLEAKAEQFDDVVKSGRTHMMDATPVRLGQEFEGYERQVSNAVERASRARDALLELALGGTAVGTGINRRKNFPQTAIKYINEDTGLGFFEAMDHFEAQGAKDACVEASGHMKTMAVSLSKIANDIRLLSSGPRTGIAEITLPSIQPGSSIMPGKINPVICESVTMVSAQVIGNDAAITLGGMGSYLELNVMMPLIAYNLLESVRLLSNVSRVFADKCISGITANESRARELVELNLSTCTALAPKIGYDKAAALSKEAFKSGRTVRDVAREQKVLPDEVLNEVLNFRRMTEPE